MVAREHADSPVEPSDEFADSVGVTETEVTEVINHCGRRDLRIPPPDKLFIHLVNIGKGPVAVLDDIRMVEMGIRRDEFVA